MRKTVRTFIHTVKESQREREENAARIAELHADYKEAMDKLTATAIDGTRYQSRALDVEVTKQRWLDAVTDAQELQAMTSNLLKKTRQSALDELDTYLN